MFVETSAHKIQMKQIQNVSGINRFSSATA
jgi:hypothetical protein